MNKPWFPGYFVVIVVVVLLGLTGCATIRAAAIEANPVSTITATTPALPTATATTTSIPNTLPTPVPPTVTPSATLFPTTPTTSTPLPAIPTLTATRQPEPTVERRLLVKQEEQMMIVFENDIVVRTIPVSTGAPITNKFTPPWQGFVGDDWGGGPFRSQQYADYMWYLFPGPEGSILIHSVPYTITNGLKVFDRPDALGVEPVSNGCVRISPEDGAWLKNWDPVGVPITITRWPGQLQPADVIAEKTTGEESKNE